MYYPTFTRLRMGSRSVKVMAVSSSVRLCFLTENLAFYAIRGESFDGLKHSHVSSVMDSEASVDVPSNAYRSFRKSQREPKVSVHF